MSSSKRGGKKKTENEGDIMKQVLPVSEGEVDLTR